MIVAGVAREPTFLEWLTVLGAAMTFVLGIVAIWLAILFYRLSTDQAERIRSSATSIESTVARLEKLFEVMYHDTFSIVQDTVADMRTHIWHKSEYPGPRTVDSPNSEVHLSSEDRAQQEEPAHPKRNSDGDSAGLESQSHDLLVAPDSLVLSLVGSGGGIRMRRLLEAASACGYSTSAIVADLFQLRESGRVSWEGVGDILTGESVVRLMPQQGS